VNKKSIDVESRFIELILLVLGIKS